MAIYCGVGKTLPRSCWGIWNHAVRGTDKKPWWFSEDPGLKQGTNNCLALGKCLFVKIRICHWTLAFTYFRDIHLALKFGCPCHFAAFKFIISFRCKVLGYSSHRDPKKPYKCWSSPATKICTFLKCGDSVERFVTKMMASQMGWPVWGHHGPKSCRPKAVTSRFSYNRYAKMCTNVKEMVIKTKTRQEQSADTWIAKLDISWSQTLVVSGSHDLVVWSL